MQWGKHTVIHSWQKHTIYSCFSSNSGPHTHAASWTGFHLLSNPTLVTTSTNKCELDKESQFWKLSVYIIYIMHSDVLVRRIFIFGPYIRLWLRYGQKPYCTIEGKIWSKPVSNCPIVLTLQTRSTVFCLLAGRKEILGSNLCQSCVFCFFTPLLFVCFPLQKSIFVLHWRCVSHITCTWKHDPKWPFAQKVGKPPAFCTVL